MCLQDYRDFYAIHAGVGCNLLMGDGSVKTIYDLNGDKMFNPGFAASSFTVLGDGYDADSPCEISSFEVFTGTWLTDPKFFTKTNLE